jgi:hypothetical protein
MFFIQNTKTDFHNREVEIEDEYSRKYQSPDGYKPMKRLKISDILKDVKDVDFRIMPRMEGAMDDQTFMEIQDMMETIAMIPEGTQAKAMVIEKMINKKYPTLGITRSDLTTPAVPPAPAGGMEMPTEVSPMPEAAGVERALAGVQ